MQLTDLGVAVALVNGATVSCVSCIRLRVSSEEVEVLLSLGVPNASALSLGDAARH